MKPFPLSFALLAGVLPPISSGQDAIVRPAEILLVGTYHMDNPGRDVVNLQADDVLEPQRQAEIEALVARLRRFEPTHVAVEMPVGEQARLDAWYASFLDGSAAPSRNEVYQVGFRLAAEANLERVDAIDHRQDLGMEATFAYAREHQPDLSRRFDEAIERLQADSAALAKRPIPEIFTALNTPDAQRELGPYMLFAQVGSAENPLGAETAAQWHARNLKIYGNLARLATREGDRILVLIGSGHAALLREFVQWSPNLRLADTLELLRP